MIAVESVRAVSGTAVFGRARVAPTGAVPAVTRDSLVLGTIVAVVAIFYVAFLSPGHAFVNDDFAAYVMHARNIVEGRPYADIQYIPNPDATWVSPANGYPPVYPLILAPVYRIFGLNLRALKVATVLCFVAFLAVYAAIARPSLGTFCTAVVLVLLSFNPVFWDQRNFILSEFPYLMFSFAALLAIEKTYTGGASREWKVSTVLLTSALLYGAYGTRTIGIALLVALIAADLARFRRPSRFLLAVLALTATLILLQTLLITSPKSYIRVFHFSLHTLATNTSYYGKTLSYVWQNGQSKTIRIVVALLFTGLAAVNFVRSLWNERGAKEFYLIAYVAVLTAWNAQIGLRGLLPVLPLYFLYGFREVSRILANALPAVRLGAIGAIAAVAAASYAGQFRQERATAPVPDVMDAGAQEMIAFLRAHTSPRDTLVFPKPRTLALFTDRNVAALSPDQPVEQSMRFITNVRSNVLIDPDWSPTPLGHELGASREKELFHDTGYRIYRVN